MHSVLTAVAALFTLLALAGAAYFAMCISRPKASSARTSHPSETRFTPPVSILRSLKGLNPHMYAAFRSHCLLDYPEYEVLFGVSDPDGPGVNAGRETTRDSRTKLRSCIVRSTGPQWQGQQSCSDAAPGSSTGTIINDSDILVPRELLMSRACSVGAAELGMVTTLYRGLAGKTLGSKLEALGLSTDFSGGVLVARAMEGGLRFGLGATIATTKTVLREIGGFEPLADYLGDDYDSARVPPPRDIRCASPTSSSRLHCPITVFAIFGCTSCVGHVTSEFASGQYFGLIVTFGLVWSMLAAALAPDTWWSWLVLAFAAALRLISAIVVGRGVLADPQVLTQLWLLPLRDAVGLAIWLTSYFGDEVEWRGLHFRLHDGKLERS